MKLYRGYVSDNPFLKTEDLKSKINIQEIIRNGHLMDAREPQYINKLFWVTPDFSYAQGVATCRYIGGILLDRKKFNSDHFTPSVIEMDIHDEPELYYADGDNIRTFTQREQPEQLLAQDLSTAQIKYFIPAIGENRRLKEYLTHTRFGDSDTVLRLTSPHQVECENLFDSTFQMKSLHGKNIRDGVQIVLDHIKRLGYLRDMQDSIDKLSRGAFVYTLLFSDFIKYREVEGKPFFSEFRRNV